MTATSSPICAEELPVASAVSAALIDREDRRRRRGADEDVGAAGDHGHEALDDEGAPIVGTSVMVGA